MTLCLSVTSICLSVSSSKPGIKYEFYAIMWHIAPESKIQLVNCELSTKFPLEYSLLPDILAIDAYIFLSLLFSIFLYAQFPFLFKGTCFLCISLSFGGFEHFAMMWSSDPHLKSFTRRVFYTSVVWMTSRTKCFSLLSDYLDFFSVELLASPPKVHFAWTVFAISLFLPKPELLSRFKSSVCKDDIVKYFWLVLFRLSLTLPGG